MECKYLQLGKCWLSPIRPLKLENGGYECPTCQQGSETVDCLELWWRCQQVHYKKIKPLPTHICVGKNYVCVDKGLLLHIRKVKICVGKGLYLHITICVGKIHKDPIRWLGHGD